MKLLFCPECYDLFKLSRELRFCHCGEVCGKYTNSTEAVVNGKGYSVAIGNGSLESRCYQSAEDPAKDRSEAITKHSILCWARPHEGPANPHTKVDPMLGKEEAA